MYPISIFLHGFSTTLLRAVMGLPRRGGASPSKSTCIRFPFFCTVSLLHVYERSCVCLGRVEPTHLSTIGCHKLSIESRAAPMEHGHEVEQGARIKGEEGKKEDGGSKKEEEGMRKEEGWHDSRFRFEKNLFSCILARTPACRSMKLNISRTPCCCRYWANRRFRAAISEQQRSGAICVRRCGSHANSSKHLQRACGSEANSNSLFERLRFCAGSSGNF